jgi:hypothetical protein
MNKIYYFLHSEGIEYIPVTTEQVAPETAAAVRLQPLY